MATFGLVPGSWHGAWCFDGLVTELELRGQRAVPVDLPRENASAGPAEYAAVVASALGGAKPPLVLVGHSMGGITIPNVAALRPVDSLVYLCALVPLPGRSWDDTHFPGPNPDDFEAAVKGLSDGSSVPLEQAIPCLYGDSPPAAGRAAWRRCGRQTYGITQKPSLDFPAIRSDYVVARRDRALWPDWCRRTAREQLGVEPIEIDGDHSPFLARPGALAELLIGLV